MKKGYILIEMIFTLSVSFIVLFNIIISLENIHRFKISPNTYTDVIIASKQISQELMQSKITAVDEDSITYIKNKQTFTLSLDDDVLVKEPGYQIFLYDIDELEFEAEDLINMKIERGKEEYETYIAINTLEN